MRGQRRPFWLGMGGSILLGIYSFGFGNQKLLQVPISNCLRVSLPERPRPGNQSFVSLYSELASLSDLNCLHTINLRLPEKQASTPRASSISSRQIISTYTGSLACRLTTGARQIVILCRLIIGLLKLYLRIEVDERAFGKNDVRSTGASSVQHSGFTVVFAWIIGKERA